MLTFLSSLSCPRTYHRPHWWWSCQWGEISQNHGYEQAYFSSPGWYVGVDSHGDDGSGWGKLPTCPPELLGSPTSREICERKGEMDKRVKISCIQYLICVNG